MRVEGSQHYVLHLRVSPGDGMVAKDEVCETFEIVSDPATGTTTLAPATGCSSDCKSLLPGYYIGETKTINYTNQFRDYLDRMGQSDKLFDYSLLHLNNSYSSFAYKYVSKCGDKIKTAY